MKVIENRGGVDSRALAEAVAAIERGEVIIYPTDTLYALGCDALSSRAIERLCRIKGINPAKQLLSIVCSDFSQAAEYARIDNRAFDIVRRHLPGPFTVILPAATTLPKAFKGRRSVGVRIPDCDFARELARELGRPVLTSSAPVDADDDSVDGHALALALEAFSDIALAVDQGVAGTEPSTVIDCTYSANPEIIRQGAAIADI